MILHLIRHAHAVGADADPLRPLSPRGRDQAARLAAFFRANGQLRPARIWHSPLARSRETAALLALGLGFAGPLVETAGLEPEDDPRVTAAALAEAPDRLVVVGHEPHLSALATLLVRGSLVPAMVTLKKCSALALERDEGHWRVASLVSPDLIGPDSR